MRSLAKKMVVSASAAALLGAGTVLGAAPAQAFPWQPQGCWAQPVHNTSAYSTCHRPVRHQVKIECRQGWGWFGSPWGSYERWGPVVWNGQQSWARCDTPGSLQRWEVMTYWW